MHDHGQLSQGSVEAVAAVEAELQLER